MVVKGKPLTLKEQWQKLKTELKDMTLRQKLEHLWEYYKWVLGIALGVVLMIAMLISMLITSNTEQLMGGVMINTEISLEGYNYLTGDYFDKLGGQKYKHSVALSYRRYEDPELTLDPGFMYDNYQSVLAMMAGGVLDYMIMDQYGMQIFAIPDFCLDLQDFLSPEELAQLDAMNAVVWVQVEPEETTSPTGETVPREDAVPQKMAVAVNINHLPFVQDNFPTARAGEPIYFAITCPDDRIDECQDFWQYILDYEPQEKTTENKN